MDKCPRCEEYKREIEAFETALAIDEQEVNGLRNQLAAVTRERDIAREALKITGDPLYHTQTFWGEFCNQCDSKGSVDCSWCVPSLAYFLAENNLFYVDDNPPTNEASA